jgi:hypothetical protein
MRNLFVLAAPEGSHKRKEVSIIIIYAEKLNSL